MDAAFAAQIIKKEKQKEIIVKRKLVNTGVLLSMFLLMSCGIPKQDFDALQQENENLKQQINSLNMEIDELKNGESRLVGLIDNAYKSEDYQSAKTYIENLKASHPESTKIDYYNKLLVAISQKEKEMQLKKEAAEKERIRLENLNNTGMWEIRHYVDSFGEPTKEGYITNKSLIKGKFSNSATSNSDLDVKFLITNSSDINIKLYEYAGDNEVKGTYDYPGEYFVYVKDQNGKEYSLNAKNSSDRLSFNTADSRIVNKILLNSKTVKFYIKEYKGSSEYNFTISNTEWYENAYRKLTE